MSSLILRSRSSLTPEMRLVKATSEFEAALTTAQKASFRNIRSKACTTPPTLKDVMELTAEIDCQAREKHKSSRSFGTRLTNMLQSVQQYAALGDVVVGGSQNLIACGVWAAVRMVLHMSIGYLSHLEKLSMLFMEAGRQAPRYQALALIYPKSKNLQSYLFEYYVVVVELCQTIHKFAQQSTFGQMMSSVKDSDLKGFHSDLQLWSSSIKEEANLLLSQHVADEAQKNSKTRLLINKWSDSAAHRQDVADRIRWLEAYSTHDFQTTWKQTRKIGSASFLSSWTQYRQWKSNDTGSAMLLSGKLGSGKSVTMANVVDDLNLENNTLVIYFFCRHDLPESLKSHNIIGSLNRQYLSHFPIGSDIFKADLTTIDAAGFASITDNPVPNKKKFLLIDGLDECDQRELRSLLQALATVHHLPGWYLGFSARLSAETPESLLASHITLKWHFTMPVENPDIELFVKSELDRRLTNGQLRVGDLMILPEIRHALITRAKGMFLWVSLQLDAICDEASDDAMREVLKTLPSDLTETYIRILRKASAEDTRKYHIRLFKFIAGAYEPLSLDQIREMAAVINGSPVWDPQKRINDVTKVLRYCGSLVVIDEEESTVRFVHHSARDFCQGVLGGNLDWHFSDEDAHREIGETVVTYLSYGIFDTRLSNRVIPKVEVQNLAGHVIQNAVRHIRFSQSLFKLKEGPGRDIGQMLARVSQQPDGGNDLAEHPFLAYARKFWLLHTKYLSPLARDTFKLWESLIKKADIHQLDPMPQIPGPLDDFEPTHEHPLLPAISWAINHSHLPLFNFLMESRHDYVVSIRLVLQKLLFFRAVFKHISLKCSDSTGHIIELQMAERLLPIAVRLGAETAVGWMARCTVSADSKDTLMDSSGGNPSKMDQVEQTSWPSAAASLHRPQSLVLLAASMKNVTMLHRLASAGVATSETVNAHALSLLLETGIDQALLLRACCIMIHAGLSPQSMQSNHLYSVLHHLTTSSELNNSVSVRALERILGSLRTEPLLLSQLFGASCAKGNLDLAVAMRPWLPESTKATGVLVDSGLFDLVLHSISKERIQLASWLLNHAADPHVGADAPKCPIKRAVLLRCWPLASRMMMSGDEVDALRHFCSRHELLHHAIFAADMDGVEFLLKLRLDANEPSRGLGLFNEHPDNGITSHGSRWPWRYSFNELLRRRYLFESAEISNPYSALEVKLGDFLDAQINHQELQSSVSFQQLLDLVEHAEHENRLTTRNVTTGYFFCLMTILIRQITLFHFPQVPEPDSYLIVDSDQHQAGLEQLVRLSSLLERVSIVGFEVTAHSEYLFLIAFHELLGVVLHFDLKLGPDDDSLHYFGARMRLWQVMKLIFDNIKLRGPWIGWKLSDLLRRLALALSVGRRMNVLLYFESIGQSEPSDKMLLEFLHFATDDDNFAWLLECMLARSSGFDWHQIVTLTLTICLDGSYLCARANVNETNPTASKALEALGCNQRAAQLLAKNISMAENRINWRRPVPKRRNAIRIPSGQGDSGMQHNRTE